MNEIKKDRGGRPSEDGRGGLEQTQLIERRGGEGDLCVFVCVFVCVS